jgi:hypothetical protein
MRVDFYTSTEAFRAHEPVLSLDVGETPLVGDVVLSSSSMLEVRSRAWDIDTDGTVRCRVLVRALGASIERSFA